MVGAPGDLDGETDAGDLDILADIPDSLGALQDYDALAARARVLRHEGIRVRVAALDDIIASKEWRTDPSIGTRFLSYEPSVIQAD